MFKKLALVALFAIGLTALSGCNETPPGGGPGGGGPQSLSGQIKIDGSSTVYPISEKAATMFRRDYPEVAITVGQKGTGGGFKRFTQGETDISDASRPIKASEFELCRDNNIQFMELPIAYDGLTIVVSQKNKFVEQLSVDDLRGIFVENRKATTWKDVNPEWPEEKIVIYAPGTDSGTFDYFQEVMGEDNLRGDMSVSENDNVLVNGVKDDEFAIGFFGAAYYFENTDTLRAVKIINPDTGEPVLPQADTIESGEYAPFSRPLFIYVKLEAAERLEVDEFVRFYLKNAAKFASEKGYVGLPTSVYDQANKQYEEQITGTCFLAEKDGALEKRSGPVTEVYKPENLVKIENGEDSSTDSDG